MAEKFHQDLSAFSIAAYVLSWGDLAQTYGEERFDIGLQLALAECAFFPTAAEVARRIPEEHYQPQRCAACLSNEGFVFVEGSRRVRRCRHESFEAQA